MMNSHIADMIFLEIGKNFSTDAYLLTTKVQGILWSISDVLIIYVMLKIVSLIREQNQKKKILYRYIFLWLSAILIPFLVITTTPVQFFILESIIFGLQFSVLIYSVVTETRDTVVFFKKIITGND
ncbi:MAG: hypothetical protein KJN80_04580 [Deltaproteobacteria bacterium]|nr:hypothetical protein [Deltaproteobacteria bacterium]